MRDNAWVVMATVFAYAFGFALGATLVLIVWGLVPFCVAFVAGLGLFFWLGNRLADWEDYT